MPDRRRRRGGLRRRSDGSNPRGLADLGLEHAQDALELGTGYEACRLSAALAVKLEAKTLALLADRHALDELGRGDARLERLSGGYRHRLRGLRQRRIALEGGKLAAVVRRGPLRQR